ncbi:MAG: hypothetical protein IIC67_00355 [Thaumarchaeota archaeon]|nr:hypothetical protein [Nitrososphaerota archaeon]
MKTRFLIIIGIMVIISFILGIILPNFYLHQDDFAVFLCDRWFFSDSHKCTRIWEDPDCHRPGGGCIFPEKNPFEQFIEKKAIMAFNLKLDEYQIRSEVQAAYPAYTTGNFKAFMAQAVTDDDTRYYLTTTFDPDDSLDKINVEIHKIISEKCNLDLILKGSGCEMKYLEKAEKNILESDTRFTENEN